MGYFIASDVETFDYYSMPPLSELDDYDICLRKPNSVYCIVDLELLEDDTPLFKFIKNFSSFTNQNYHHHQLHRGVCGSQNCGLNSSHASFDSNETAVVLKDCFNTTLHRGYGLQVDHLTIRYCKTPAPADPPDALDIVVGVILIAIILMNTASSAYYYMTPPEKGEGNRLLLAFAVQKNWKALKKGGASDGGIFKCFQALRFYTMVMILGLHSLIFIGYGYTANPEFIEEILFAPLPNRRVPLPALPSFSHAYADDSPSPSTRTVEGTFKCNGHCHSTFFHKKEELPPSPLCDTAPQ
ncbi:hypothetical protein EVAR_48587_1 [Eumeta japonica]|uniref:Nose resistant to fluoxetine protein 6 n=1 Tax=Eumeta variegata TaxID=151549 RepID=A0A4C1XCD7_EUMVA|nr:hypothetical protein EVAR_48587_1 [Eumeta japonica]